MSSTGRDRLRRATNANNWPLSSSAQWRSSSAIASGLSAASVAISWSTASNRIRASIGEELRKQARQRCSRRRGQTWQRFGIARYAAVAKGFEPRSESEQSFALVGMTDERSRCDRRRSEQLRHETALANSCLSEYQDRRAPVQRKVGERLAKMSELARPSDEPRARCRHRIVTCRPGAGPRRRRRRRGTEDGLVQRLGRRLRLDVELTAEDVDAELILTERGRPAAGVDVQLHEGAVHGLCGCTDIPESG